LPRLNLNIKKAGAAAKAARENDSLFGRVLTPAHSRPQQDSALSSEGQALLEEVDQLAGEVLAPERVPPEPMSRKLAVNIRKTAGAFYIVAVVFCVLLTITWLLNAFAPNGVFGVRFFVEPTNAMPQAPYGSLLITVTRPSAKIRPGDIITYYALPGEPDTRLTRIVDERLENNDMPLFSTKRAENAAPDSMLINMTHILGVKLAVIPYAGHVISFVQTYAAGLAVLAGALTVAAVVMRLWANREHPEIKRMKKKKKAQKRRKGRVRHAV